MVEIRKTSLYVQWFDSLRDRQARARVDVRVFRLANGNPGQHRSLTDGVVGAAIRLAKEFSS